MILAIGIGQVILISILVFLLVIMLLVAVLLYARRKLTPQGKVNITINDDKVLEVDPGSTLLTTLLYRPTQWN